MKKLAVSVALCTLLGTSLNSYASVTPSADGTLIYDSDLNITWLADANYSQTSGYHSTGNMNWYDAHDNWVNNLTIQNHHDWRLPTIDEMSHLFSRELGGTTNKSILDDHNANFNLFSNFQVGFQQQRFYWSGTEDTNDPSKASIFTFHGGNVLSGINKDIGYSAMAVSAGNIAIVPEPETYAMLLAGLGLVCCMVRRSK